MPDQPTEPRYPTFHSTLFSIMIWVFRLIAWLLARVHAEGAEHFPDEGAVIVVTNHLNYFDTPVVAMTLPRPSYVLAAEKYEHHPWMSLILKTAGAIFIQRGEVDRRALRQARNVLEDGHVLSVAVEGTRSQTGGLARGKTGTAYLATRTDATLVPVAVWGTEGVIDAWKHLRRPDVYIRYGEPFRLPAGRARSPELDTYTDEIMARIAGLLPLRYRGVYRDHPLVARFEVGKHSAN
jgi:1-acyl-sn-glycerol-3-phosphate acyltransferase